MKALTSRLTHPAYRPDIDGLRAVAVLAVVAFHAFPAWFRGGFIGVDIFFAISGFLISKIIFENLDNGTFSFAEFYAQRARRIFPALSTVLITCLIFGWFALFPDELNQLGRHVAGGAGFVSNFVLWSEAGYFDHSANSKPLLHLWSLGIEEQFYIVWPFILWYAWKKNINLFALTVFIASFSFYLNIEGVKTDPIATFYSPQTRLWELLSGSLLARLPVIVNRFHIEKLIFKKNIRTTASSVISCLGCLLLIYGLMTITDSAEFPGKIAIIPLLGTILIILAGPGAWINRSILSHKVPVQLGLISFPLYLWHWPLISFATIIENGKPSIIFRTFAILLSFALAWLTVKLIENPFRRGTKWRRLKLSFLCLFIISIGVAGHIVGEADFYMSKWHDKLAIRRKGQDQSYDHSIYWFAGKNDWLFLGNAVDKSIDKLTLRKPPDSGMIASTKEVFSRIAKASAKYNTKLALIIGPDKPSIYPEYLPDELKPSRTRYISYTLEQLNEIPGLSIYDPTTNAIKLEKSSCQNSML